MAGRNRSTSDEGAPKLPPKDGVAAPVDMFSNFEVHGKKVQVRFRSLDLNTAHARVLRGG